MSDQDIEGRWCIRLLDALAGDDCIECGRASQDVVGLDSEYLAKRVCGAVAEEGPDFHLADRDRLCKRFASTAVEERALAALVESGFRELFFNLLFSRARKRRHDRLIAGGFSREAEVEFEYLTEVHTSRHTERSEDDVYRFTVFVERHVLFWKHARDDALVSVTAGEFIAHRDSAELRHFYMYALDDTALEAVPVLAGEYFDTDDTSAFAALHAKRRVFYVL